MNRAQKLIERFSKYVDTQMVAEVMSEGDLTVAVTLYDVEASARVVKFLMASHINFYCEPSDAETMLYVSPINMDDVIEFMENEVIDFNHQQV